MTIRLQRDTEAGAPAPRPWARQLHSDELAALVLRTARRAGAGTRLRSLPGGTGGRRNSAVRSCSRSTSCAVSTALISRPATASRSTRQLRSRCAVSALKRRLSSRPKGGTATGTAAARTPSPGSSTSLTRSAASRVSPWTCLATTMPAGSRPRCTSRCPAREAPGERSYGGPWLDAELGSPPGRMARRQAARHRGRRPAAPAPRTEAVRGLPPRRERCSRLPPGCGGHRKRN